MTHSTLEHLTRLVTLLVQGRACAAVAPVLAVAGLVAVPRRGSAAHCHWFSLAPTHCKMLDADGKGGRPNPSRGENWCRDCCPHCPGLDLTEPIFPWQSAGQTRLHQCLQSHLSRCSTGDRYIPLPQHWPLGDMVLPQPIPSLLWRHRHPFGRTNKETHLDHCSSPLPSTLSPKDPWTWRWSHRW